MGGAGQRGALKIYELVAVPGIRPPLTPACQWSQIKAMVPAAHPGKFINWQPPEGNYE